MKVSIVGTGYVGLVTGACLAEYGHEVICVDVDSRKIEMINSARAPIHESGLPELLQRNLGRRLRASTNLAAAASLAREIVSEGSNPRGSVRIREEIGDLT